MDEVGDASLTDSAVGVTVTEFSISEGAVTTITETPRQADVGINEDPDSSKDKETEINRIRQRHLKIFERMMTWAVFLIIAAVFSVPTILFAVHKDEDTVPNCEGLLNIRGDCVGTSNASHNESSPDDITLNQDLLNCSDGFFRNENGTVCTPECGEFNPKSQVAVITELTSACAGFLASVILLLLLGLPTQRKKLLSFPSIFFIYISLISIVRDVLTLVKFGGNTTLMCGSRNLLEAITDTSTPFCTFSGLADIYSNWQVCIWVLMFAVVLFWGVKYPFSYRNVKNKGKICYVHAAGGLLAVFVPLIVLVNLVDGYRISIDSPYNCIGRNPDYRYYTFFLPLSIIVAATSFLLVLIFWTIFREFVLMKVLLGKEMGKVGKGQLKITILIIHQILHGTLGIVGSVYVDRNDNFQEDLEDFLSCESMGAPSNCEQDIISTGEVASDLFTASQVILNLVPVLILIINYDLLFRPKKRVQLQATRTGTTHYTTSP